MDQRISFITLGVLDLEAQKKFYKEKFGWKPMLDRDGVVFFNLNGTVLCLFPRHELAEDARLTNDDCSDFKGFSLSVNYSSEEEVDKVFEDLAAKGVAILKPAEKAFWGGYSGYASDPENNLWEIAYNPFLMMDPEGNVLGHE